MADRGEAGRHPVRVQPQRARVILVQLATIRIACRGMDMLRLPTWRWGAIAGERVRLITASAVP